MRDFLSGAISMRFLVSGLFFLRFWSRTREPLFAAFAAAFAMLAANQLLLTLIRAPAEERSWVFLLRLAAFAIILAAIVAKNWQRRSAGGRARCISTCHRDGIGR